MRPICLATLLLLATPVAFAGVPVRVDCEVGISSVELSTPTVHSAGLAEIVDKEGEPVVHWFGEDMTIKGTHRIFVQSSNSELARVTYHRIGSASTYVRAEDVALGQVYVGALDGAETTQLFDFEPCYEEAWEILWDPEPPSPKEDNSPPGDGTCQEPFNCDDGTPILIDLDGGWFELTDLSGGVDFDIDRDGTAERVSWTRMGSGDGWLALDRNGNGTIDDGGELFGDVTDQPLSDDPHGFSALAVFDTTDRGGDGDGWITPVDEVFSDLRLWIDANHDGRSQPEELTGLQDQGVTALHLFFVESRSRDGHGNRLRFQAAVQTTAGRTRAVDVYLLTAP